MSMKFVIFFKLENHNPNTANEDGLTPIHQCSIDNSDKLLRLLIEYGARC